jgi:cytosine/adenosine deaminase-related metal-dependent hydrolase
MDHSVAARPQIPAGSGAVVIGNGDIADVTAVPQAHAETSDIPGGIVCHGFLNLHNHSHQRPVVSRHP